MAEEPFEKFRLSLHLGEFVDQPVTKLN